MKGVDGIIVYEENKIIGLLTYVIGREICEIISLDSLKEGMGIGKELIKIARKNECIKITVITTNDNTNAISFYQKRQFNLVRLNYNAIEASRKIKPDIPEIGGNGILINTSWSLK